MSAISRRLLRWVECASWAAGLVGLAWWAAFQVGMATSTRQDLRRFDAVRSLALDAGPPDQSLWSPSRVAAWRMALRGPSPPPLAVLRIPKIRLEVPVLRGTDDRTLDRAVGQIDGTAEPGADGNLGIAGHRDGFFRGLKDLVQGDVIEVDTMQGTTAYRVERTWVVDPDDVSVLDPTPERTLTLVTCYPFYFIGSAPRRFIVRAARAAEASELAPASVARARGLPVGSQQ